MNQIEKIKLFYQFCSEKYSKEKPLSYSMLQRQSERWLGEKKELFDILMPLLFLGLLEIAYIKQNNFYFMVMPPYQILGKNAAVRIGSHLLLNTEKLHSTQQGRLGSASPKDILRKYPALKQVKDNLERIYERQIRPAVTEQWSCGKWLPAGTGIRNGFFRTKNTPKEYFLIHNDYAYRVENDLYYHTAKCVGTFLQRKPVIEIQGANVKPRAILPILVERALWGEALLQSTSPEILIERWTRKESVFPVSSEVLQQITRIFKDNL